MLIGIYRKTEKDCYNNFFTYIRKYDSNRRRAENDTTAPEMPEFL